MCLRLEKVTTVLSKLGGKKKAVLLFEKGNNVTSSKYTVDHVYTSDLQESCCNAVLQVGSIVMIQVSTTGKIKLEESFLWGLESKRWTQKYEIFETS